MSGDELDDEMKDWLVAAGRAVVSVVPLVGGALGEILTNIIPEQRADRIVSYLRQLSERLARLETHRQAEIVGNPAKVDIVEEGGFQAARALSDERITQIVDVVVAGLTGEDASAIRRKRILTILGELDDDEVCLLNAYGRNYGNVDDEAWDAINRPEPLDAGSSDEEEELHSLFYAGEEHLVRLGLLKKIYETSFRATTPEFDSSLGDFKHRIELAELGRQLLKHIGKPSQFDIRQSEDHPS